MALNTVRSARNAITRHLPSIVEIKFSTRELILFATILALALGMLRLAWHEDETSRLPQILTARIKHMKAPHLGRQGIPSELAIGPTGINQASSGRFGQVSHYDLPLILLLAGSCTIDSVDQGYAAMDLINSLIDESLQESGVKATGSLNGVIDGGFTGRDAQLFRSLWQYKHGKLLGVVVAECFFIDEQILVVRISILESS